jgi:septal ring-binding cell division protein DamX
MNSRMNNTYKKLFHLDRFEVFMVTGLLFLVCGLVFTLGVLVGYGLGPGALNGKGASLAKSTHDAISHKNEVRKPAAATGPSSGGGLRTAFRDAKQQALNDLSTKEGKETSSDKPKSVPDAEAHFEANPDPGRAIAAEASPAARAPAAEVVPAEKKEVPSGVKGLFERKPAALGYAPKAGSFTVQIASYPTEDESRAKMATLRKSGLNDAYYEAAAMKSGEKWYRVGVGSYPSPEWAQKTGEKLVRRGLAKDYVVRQVK